MKTGVREAYVAAMNSEYAEAAGYAIVAIGCLALAGGLEIADLTIPTPAVSMFEPVWLGLGVLTSFWSSALAAAQFIHDRLKKE